MPLHLASLVLGHRILQSHHIDSPLQLAEAQYLIHEKGGASGGLTGRQVSPQLLYAPS